MPREKQAMRREQLPCGFVVVGNFCAALVRTCQDATSLSAAFGSLAGPVSSSPANSFDFVTGIVQLLAARRLISCVDALRYSASVAKRAPSHSEVRQRTKGNSKTVAVVDSSAASVLRSSSGQPATTFGDILASASSALKGSFTVIGAIQAEKADEERTAWLIAEDRRERKSRLLTWEAEVEKKFAQAAATTTNDELDYFDSLQVLEYALLETFRRVDAAASGFVTWSTFMSFLSDCTNATPSTHAHATGIVSAAADMLLGSEDARSHQLDTAEFVQPWPSRHSLVALCVEHHRQTLSILDSTELTPWRTHIVLEAVGKVLGIEVIPALNAIAIITYAGLRIHDAENFLCKATVHEKELLSCVRWIPSCSTLLAGNQGGCVIEYDLSDMDRAFYASHKPFTNVRRKSRKAHCEIVTDILRATPTNFVTSSSMDGTIVMQHRDSSASRVFRGASVVSMCLVEHLGLILAFGVDALPFAYSYNVLDSTSLVLGASGTRGHPARIVGVGLLDDEDYAATVDKGGTVKVWDLVANACIQTVSATDQIESGQFMTFHVGLVDETGVQIIGRRRRFRMPYNAREYGRVAPKAAQSAVTSVVYDERAHVVIAAVGLELQFWSVVNGRLQRSQPVCFLPPPPGAPHGSVADQISSLVFAADFRHLYVLSDKYVFNVHCAATGVCRSRHVLPVHNGTLIGVRPLPVADIPGRPAESALVTAQNANPRIVLHQALVDAVAGAQEAALRESGGGGVTSPRRKKGNSFAKSVSVDTHVLDRLMLSSTSDSLRVRLAAHLRPMDVLLCCEVSSAWDVSASLSSATTQTISAWRRLSNGGWSKTDQYTFDEMVINVVVPNAAVHPSLGHFAAVLASGFIAILTVDTVGKLTHRVKFAHRPSDDGPGSLNVQYPTSLTFLSTLPHLLVVGDDLGSLSWYDVGNALHVVADPPTPDPQDEAALLVATSRERSLSPSHELSLEASLEATQGPQNAPTTNQLPPAPACVGCGISAADVAQDVPTVWLLRRQRGVHGDAVASVAAVRVPFVGQDMVASSGHDGTIKLSTLAQPSAVNFVDLSKRIIGSRPESAFVALMAADRTPLPEVVATARWCDRTRHGGRYTRCSAAVAFGAAGASTSNTPGIRSPVTAGLVPSPSTVVPSTLTPLAIGGNMSFAQSPQPFTFLTASPTQTDFAQTGASPALATDGDETDLPAARSVQGLGLTPEQCVALYKEWVFGEQERLGNKRLTRLERMKILHDVHVSNVIEVVEGLLQTDDRFYGEVKEKHSPRLEQSPASDTLDTHTRRLPDGRLLPSLGTLRRLARPGGRVRKDVTDAPRGDDRHLTMPPIAREAQLQAEHRTMLLKAQFDYKARVSRRPDEVRAALETIEEMPRDAFLHRLRRDAARAARIEDAMRQDRASRAARLLASTPDDDYTAKSRFPASDPRRTADLPSTTHERTAGGASTRRRIPRYRVEPRDSSPVGSLPPPRGAGGKALTPEPGGGQDGGGDHRCFTEPMTLRPRKMYS
jgi:WD40 repeat protein